MLGIVNILVAKNGMILKGPNALYVKGIKNNRLLEIIKI